MVTPKYVGTISHIICNLCQLHVMGVNILLPDGATSISTGLFPKSHYQFQCLDQLPMAAGTVYFCFQENHVVCVRNVHTQSHLIFSFSNYEDHQPVWLRQEEKWHH